MQAFSYERPKTLATAIEMMAGETARALAGGTDLIPQLREGRRSAGLVVDLKHVPAFVDIERLRPGGWRIGAAASIRRLGAEADLKREHPGLIEAARLIGSLQVQSRASLGGNLANGAPSADAVPLLISLEAVAEVAGPSGTRRVAVADIPAGPGRSTLLPGELIVAMLLPARPERSAARYLRFTPRREMDIAVAGSGVALELGAGGEIVNARITLASVGPVPIRAEKAERRLTGERASEALIAEAARIAATEASPISDTRASAGYRRELVDVLTRRALAACIAEATREGGR